MPCYGRANGRTHIWNFSNYKEDVGATIAIELYGSTYAPLHDFRGNIIALLSSKGKLIETYDLDAFGRETTLPLHPINPWRFCSKRSDEGFVFFGMRFYDPSLQRWLTPDPSGFADGPNLYAYVQNNPLNRLDLFGLYSDSIANYIPNFAFNIQIPISPNMPLEGLVRGQIMWNGNVLCDVFVFSRSWNKLQFNPEELKVGKINIVDHFHELLPKNDHRVVSEIYQHGVDTPLRVLEEVCLDMIKAMPYNEGLFIGLHNPTFPLVVPLADWVRAMDELLELDTFAIHRTAMVWGGFAESLHNYNPHGKCVGNVHSEGGIQLTRAIEMMGPEQQQILQSQFILRTFGSPLMMPKFFGLDVWNIVSSEDKLARGAAKSCLNNSNYNVNIMRCLSPKSQWVPFAGDHGILGATYRTAYKKDNAKLTDQYGFYDGNTR
jgi:RHS repeat-associated protein